MWSILSEVWPQRTIEPSVLLEINWGLAIVGALVVGLMLVHNGPVVSNNNTKGPKRVKKATIAKGRIRNEKS